MARLVLSLLGPFQVFLDEQPITGFESVKVRALLAYLAAEANRPHRRETLAALLWPDWPPQSAMSNLRYALADLRKNIADREANPPYLLINRESIQLNRESNLWIDVKEFESATQESSTTDLQSAIHLYRGAFLEGFSLPDSAPFEEWLLAKREYLSQQILKSLGRLAEACSDQGDYDQAERYARRQIEMEPWREKAYQQLMRASSLRGERVQSLAQFEDLRKALERELKVKPSEETIQLYRQIRDGKVEARTETAIAVETTILPLSEKPRHNLPRLLTTFIGRENEIAEVKQEFAEHRLVTLTGSGGAGKSRLSLQVAADLPDDFPSGIWFVELAPLSDPNLIAQTILTAVEIKTRRGKSALESLIDFFREKSCLLVLDNCEHLLDACARLADTLLSAAPHLKILASSQR